MLKFGKLFRNRARGFTLVEIMLVSVIVATALAIVIPRALRAKDDAKYNLVRQAGAEMAKWGVAWAEKALSIQQSTDTCVLNTYYNTLRG
jgi:prepilin-type N-terminal cleavage/methylation domain-containing protein